MMTLCIALFIVSNHLVCEEGLYEGDAGLYEGEAGE